MLPRERLERMVEHLLRVLEANRRIRLTAIDDPHEAVELHVLDSLTGLPLLPGGPGPVQVVDIGTGAGFPGVPLALAAPERLRLVLLEPHRRRAGFLQVTVAQLEIGNARVVAARAEEFGRREGRERFDAAVIRAVAPLPVALEYGLPLLRVGGRLVAYRGREGEREAEQAGRALAVLGGEVVAVRRLRLPASGAERTLVAVEKRAPTPETFPRRPGVPERRPLA